MFRLVLLLIQEKAKVKKAGRNYSLEYDPLGTGKRSFMKRQGTIQRKQMYDGNYRGRMTLKDYAKAREYGNKAKLKYLRNRKK